MTASLLPALSIGLYLGAMLLMARLLGARHR
jgi:hypothetical protein